ncbi:RNA polymerase sigma factor [Amniculibacterium aquaticum]|uniref:RNA polymerase sigma factor n=1 Tax=Amniculibacterium aquaticum TaxID=2479858 RepID=UPI000F5A442E|nr:RNA polymerase sigma factor [Amniculibacterium aquaticum]
MKIISIHNNQKVEDLLPQLRKQNRLAQKELFDRLSRKMLAICRSYINDIHHAEDCMLKAFVKTFRKIEAYQSNGSFEGWIRRIMVNECLDFLKLNKSFVYLEDADWKEVVDFEEDINEIDVHGILDQLTENYRMVFNLYVLEDYSHKEIAETLGISEATSKVQLMRAKKKVKELILQQKEKCNENEFGK